MISRCLGVSVSAYAAGAAVALVGKQEGGRTLSREAVFAVLKRLHEYFTDGSIWARTPVKSVMASFQRIVTLSISDANKKHMIEFEPSSTYCLSVCCWTRATADTVRRARCAAGGECWRDTGAVAVWARVCALLRSHGEVISSLHRLMEVGTKVSKERGAAALFELDEETRAAAQSGSAKRDGARRRQCE